METPNWEPLYEREPKLRFINEDGEQLEQRPGKGEGRWVWRSACGLRHTGFMDSVGAALQRDAATMFLKKWGRTPSRTPVTETELQGLIERVRGALLGGDDLDLFETCRAVLDALNAAPTR